MNFLGMGPMELMMILVLALIVFGPGKLPEIAGQVGKVVRDFRRTTSELSSEFNRTLSLEVEERKTRTQTNQTVAEAVPYEAPPVPETSPVVQASVAPPTAVEPAEAPPAELAPAASTTVSTAAPDAPVSNGVAPATASKRRTYDADLAPPY